MMDDLVDIFGARRSDAPLLYRRPTMRGLIEVARVRGAAVALPTHFHDEDQITFVVLGRRRFHIGGALVEVASGQSIRLPPGTPHSSLDEPDGVVCLNAYLSPGGDAGASLAEMTGPRGRVRDAAAAAGLSREGFSRAFRRTHGLAPSVAGALARLNLARGLLRAGVPLASAAAEAGFADQSHLGRCFRRAFGVTPGLFRAGFAGSHPFQTRASSTV